MAEAQPSPQSVSELPPSEPPIKLSSEANSPPTTQRVFVEPPKLSPAKRDEYKPLNALYANVNVNQVVGDIEHQGALFYFARRDGGMVYRFPADFFRKKFPELLDDYNHKKDMDALAPFDPSADYVHPMFRIKIPPRAKDHVVSSGASDYATEYESTGDDDSDGNARRKQPMRFGKPKRKALPFSPRKTRSRGAIMVHGTDSESEDESDGFVPVRRSSRKVASKPATRKSEDDVEYRGSVKAKASKVRKVKMVPPQYGAVRDISTIDADPISDDEENVRLRFHRSVCEKCRKDPAHELLAALKKKGKGKRKRKGSADEFDYSDEEERFRDMGGWVQCLKCPVSAHWRCVNRIQQEEMLKAMRARDKIQQRPDSTAKSRTQLRTDEITVFICGACSRGGSCMGCKEELLQPRVDNRPEANGDITMADGTEKSALEIPGPARELFFRCFTCKRLSHYQHLQVPRGVDTDGALSTAELAEYYQDHNDWLCADCISFQYKPDKIIAWRPDGTQTREQTPSDEGVNYKDPLPREYLIKWERRSYRRIQWVPHMWLLSTHPSKLRNFLDGKTKVQLLEVPVGENTDAMDVEGGDSGLGTLGDAAGAPPKPAGREVDTALEPLADAERWIPPMWSNIDRVLTVLMRVPKPAKPAKRRKGMVIDSEDDEISDELVDEDILRAFEQGEEPPKDKVISIDEWEERTGRELAPEDMNQAVWGFFKWQDLGYEEATWDSPPRAGEKGHSTFANAFKRFIDSRSVKILKRTKKEYETFDKRPPGTGSKYLLKEGQRLDLGQAPNLNLLSFQVDGFNWLVQNWWDHQPCILADEMGLGKTIQIATFLGHIMDKLLAFPALIVVPNSTLTNWVREFERWAPRLRVVPFYGDKESRDVIKKFELFHDFPPEGCIKSKFHVLVTTYETITNSKDGFPIFKNQPRWEVLVVDEGQRLKNDNSLLFRKLNELHVVHRIIMTGTPLNNNIRELFNLMNFLDEDNWTDLDELSKEYEVLSEELIRTLHDRLRPYFLRRTKEVLDLPPKGEVIVPVSMAPLQKEVYRSILTHNFDILNGLGSQSFTVSKGKLKNVLMELRKCIQHPYLSARDIEPRDLTNQEAHHKLIDASGKLRFLKTLLPKLKQQGHRVLLFSQFVIALDIVEDFLTGEGYKFLRLDGNTKNADRQKAMDNFNKPDSEYFIFLLTTRAGGVGINLFTADTVIIFDPDFNPQQDLQAIARSYRHGQKKTCLVFKLMVKDSAEERIMQIAKKKRVLDHLIVQKINDEDDAGVEDVQSILLFGAQAIFAEGEADREINHTEQDVERLIEKTEKEAVKETAKSGGAMSFDFAKVWAAEKDTLDEMGTEETADSWALAIQKMNEARLKQQSTLGGDATGRGRRKAADAAKTKMKQGVTQEASLASVLSPQKDKRGKDKGKRKGTDSDASDYQGPLVPSESSDSDVGMISEGEDLVDSPPRHRNILLAGSGYIDCGLCGDRHGRGECSMVTRSENLAEYREMLLLHEGDESVEDRQAAIHAIDEILSKRGHIHLIYGQPLRLVSNTIKPPEAKKVKLSAQVQGSSSLSVPLKKPKQTGTCAVCHESFHVLKNCRVVKAGPQSIANHIQLLEGRGDHASLGVANNLRGILVKLQSKERKGTQ